MYMCRSSLTLLEGWACQVGFKGAVLHHLAKLSSILDILATPPQQLLQVCSRMQHYPHRHTAWKMFCVEVKVLLH